MTITPDRQERHDALVNFEDKLTNGKRGDIATMCDHLVEMSKAMRVVLMTEFVTISTLDAYCNERHSATHNERRITWPLAAVIVGLAVPVVTKLLGLF
jgi:hypothetical protein